MEGDAVEDREGPRLGVPEPVGRKLGLAEREGGCVPVPGGDKVAVDVLVGLIVRGAVRVRVVDADVLRVLGRVAEAVDVGVADLVEGGARVPDAVEDGVREWADVPVALRVAVADRLALVVAERLCVATAVRLEEAVAVPVMLPTGVRVPRGVAVAVAVPRIDTVAVVVELGLRDRAAVADWVGVDDVLFEAAIVREFVEEDVLLLERGGEAVPVRVTRAV